MPVSKSDAIAAAKALNGSVNAVVNNAKYHDKSHWSKQNAIAALNYKPVCGYYWRKEVKEKWTKKGDQSDSTYEKPTPKKLKLYTQAKEISFHAVGINDCWRLLSHALGQASISNGEFREGDAGTRVVVATEFPEGYGGWTLYNDERGDTPCDYIAVVIETGGGAANAQIVTHFPASKNYIDGKAVLK
ncbi:hypothetical protein [Methylomonas sp. ZR1]|uniref:hypothetical protein n=1 Tax=Methylomonas sp. ZR1 TaxID=1797072 RepID=UPI0014929A3F|nr:hypothetical protein [Methylomonas sp. ZR1]NOV32189.1 hypothetical protein [Methylomonas sp. ZR1]